jgi:hypothetical protein
MIVIPDKPKEELDAGEPVIQVATDSPPGVPEPATSEGRVRDRGLDRDIRNDRSDAPGADEPAGRPPRATGRDKPDRESEKREPRRPAGVVDDGIG